MGVSYYIIINHSRTSFLAHCFSEEIGLVYEANCVDKLPSQWYWFV